MKTYQIHFIRNGLTDGNIAGQYIGQTDIPLSPDGVLQIKQIKEDMVYPNADAVFSSPMMRCTQTAHAIFGKDPIVIDDLKEYDFGEFEGKTAEQLQDYEEFSLWLSGGPDAAPPYGESNAEFSKRIYDCFVKIVNGLIKTGTTQSAIVTHGGVIMALLSMFGIPEAPMHEWRTPNACGYTVRITPSIWSKLQKMEVIAEIPEPSRAIHDEDIDNYDDLSDFDDDILYSEAFFVDVENTDENLS